MIYTREGSVVRRERMWKLSFTPYLVAAFLLLFGQVQYASFTVKIVSVVAVFFWAFTALLENYTAFCKALSTKGSILILLSLLFRLVVLLLSPYGVSNSIEYTLAHVAMFMPLLAFQYYQRTLSLRQMKVVTGITLVLWLSVIVSIITYLDFNLELARMIGAGLTESRGFFGSLIDVAVGTGCITLALFGVRKRLVVPALKKRFHWLFIVFLLLLLLDGYYTQSFIAFFLSMLFIVMEWVSPNREGNLRRSVALASIAVAVAGFFFFLMAEQIGDLFLSTASVFEGSIFEEKFIEIGVSLKGGNAVGNIGVRVNHLSTSFQTFVQNPLFGTAPNLGYVLDHDLVGRHSGLDLFARFGLFGALPAVLGYWEHLKDSVRLTNGFLTRKLLFFVIAYMILAGWDHVESIYAIGFIAPAIAYIAMKEQEQLT